MLKTAKEVFAETLKKMLEKKRLSNITVKDIVENSGLSRQAFYYHFNDIYDLVEWIFLEEAEDALANNRDIDTWQEGYYQILLRLYNNKALVVNTYRSVSREHLERFMYEVLFDLIYPVVEKQAEGMRVAKEHQRFIAHFYSLAVIAVSIDWVRTDMKETPEKIVAQVAALVKGDFKKALENMKDFS